ncbi:hypothetical protein AAG570_001902 [Ranatra chinensis]|uniref:Uncharacterized protein n=1 Tax=Ranatra chinensis TaxID=642074 RepID=A0ABD0YNV3_9HEMI
MVRIGTLPMRLLALKFGADLVYTEELIDWKLLRSNRRVNDVLQTVDYVDRTDGTIVFRTCQQEKPYVILQLGTSDPERALMVAKLVENDVSGIDVNMGCPKEFSIKGGMGAALMSDPERAEAILRKLVGGVSIPVTCKIRVLESETATMELCARLADCGISSIAIHGRTKMERPQHPNRTATIRRIAQSLQIPVIANGASKEIDSYADILKFREESGCSSVMIARGAEWNASLFRKEGRLPLDDVIRMYLLLAVDTDNPPANTKYCVQNMLRELQESERGKAFLEAQTLLQICELWGLGDYCRKRQAENTERGFSGRSDVCPVGATKRKLEDDIVEMRCSFLRALYPRDVDLPKSRLLAWTRMKGFKIPVYATQNMDKLFQSTVTVNGKKYGSSFWEKNKRWAEQGAAIVCLCAIGVLDAETLRKDGVMQ